MSGNWGEVWDSVGCSVAAGSDRRKAAKAANDGGAGAEASAKLDGDDMFSRAGVTAE